MLVEAIEAHATATLLSETILKRRRHTSALKYLQKCDKIWELQERKRDRERRGQVGAHIPLGAMEKRVAFDAHLADCGRVAAIRVRVNSELNT